MSKSYKKIADPTKPLYQQAALFPSSKEPARYDPFPRLYQGSEATKENFLNVLHEAAHDEGLIGVDLEFNDSRPTIIGIASRNAAIALRWDADLAREVISESYFFSANIVGHSTIGAEKQELEKALGIKTPANIYDCSMIAHHLVNADMTKLAGKDENEEAGSLGLMGLWTVASLYTDLPMWKDCRGGLCEGVCPRHSVFDYCAVDSWASLAAFYKLRDEMNTLGIPQSFYRDRVDLTDICVRMEKNGLRIDRAWVAEMEKRGNTYKDKLFPFEIVNGKTVYTQFNPKSRAQILSYCKTHGISLEDTTKKDIAKSLEVAARKEGITAPDIDKLCNALETASELSENLTTLLNLYQYKNSGKGVKSWFNETYFGKDGRVHPRFVTTGASTGRLSSSKPNFQNVPNKGWGEEIKKAIIPEEGCDFLESDFSQLELRTILHLCGVDMKDIGKDAFVWLVENSKGQFTKAAVALSLDERSVAKALVHGTNYLEGIQVLSPADLAKPNIRAEVEYGARVIYQKKYKPQLSRDWDYCGGIVSFTGANLAERLFGDRSLANRKRAISILEEVYFTAFWPIREWQMRVAEQAEKGYIQSPVGRYLRLYGTPEENAKIGCAFLGSGVGADHVQGIMLRFDRELGQIPAMQVHDSLVFNIPKEWSNEKAKEFISLMQQESGVVPGFTCPGKVKRGPTYGDIKAICLTNKTD